MKTGAWTGDPFRKWLSAYFRCELSFRESQFLNLNPWNSPKTIISTCCSRKHHHSHQGFSTFQRKNPGDRYIFTVLDFFGECFGPFWGGISRLPYFSPPFGGQFPHSHRSRVKIASVLGHSVKLPKGKKTHIGARFACLKWKILRNISMFFLEYLGVESHCVKIDGERILLHIYKGEPTFSHALALKIISVATSPTSRFPRLVAVLCRSHQCKAHLKTALNVKTTLQTLYNKRINQSKLHANYYCYNILILHISTYDLSMILKPEWRPCSFQRRCVKSPCPTHI